MLHFLRNPLLAASLVVGVVASLAQPSAGQSRVTVFSNAGVQFGGDANWNRQDGVTRLDNGRYVQRTVTLPEISDSARVTTQLNIWAAEDPWDRAGTIELLTQAGPVELHKFITGFGGTTTHQQDASNLIPFLRQGPVTIRAFIDTWVQEAWTLDFSLQVENRPELESKTWNYRVFNDQDWRAGEFSNNRRKTGVYVPPGMDKIYLNYLASGHASDGNGGDEFTQRVHRIYIDGVEVHSFTPWRTDGRRFRSVNPRSGRWGDVWSSDFDRAGWIPGDDVDPYVLDVSQYLDHGQHTIEYEIEGIQPAGDSGYGYWRASSYLSGFAVQNDADFNGDGAINGADFLTWQRGQGLSGQLNNANGDANGDGAVDAADLASWSGKFGVTTGTRTAPIPEPTSLAMAVMIALACSVKRMLGGERIDRGSR